MRHVQSGCSAAGNATGARPGPRQSVFLRRRLIPAAAAIVGVSAYGRARKSGVLTVPPPALNMGLSRQLCSGPAAQGTRLLPPYSGDNGCVLQAGWLAELSRQLGGTLMTMLLSASLVFCAPATSAYAAAPQHAGAGAERRWVSEGDMASVGEDTLLELVKQVEARMNSAVEGVTDVLPSLKISEEEAPQEAELASELVKEVWEVVDQNYLDARGTGFDHERWRRLRDEALARGPRNRGAAYRAIRDMLARGLSDPYTRFITPKEFDGMRKYDITGVGLNLGTTEEYTRKLQRELPRGRDVNGDGVWVLGLIKGSQAEMAGIEQGDEVLAVDNNRVASKSPFQVSSAIQGEEDSPDKVSITVAKGGNSGSVRTVSVPRAKQGGGLGAGVVSSELRGDVGYIRLASMTGRAQADVSAAVRDLEARGARELVLDLRDNRGGLVTSGVEVARLFLDEGSVVVTTKGPSSRPEQRIMAPGPPLSTSPLTVLVNEHTASASEILAGALKDNCRAVLVGSTTYGKGLIQSVYELSDSSGIVITVGKYVTPAGKSIDRDGIKPDFSRKPTREAQEESLKACRLR